MMMIILIIILIITLVLMDEGHIQKAKPLKVSSKEKDNLVVAFAD